MVKESWTKFQFRILIFLFINVSIHSQTISVLSPNGNEYWTNGSFPRITWKSTNVIAVKIEFSSNGGNTWETLSPATIAQYGSYSNWKINNIFSNECLVKISKYDDPNVFDISDSYFNITTDSTVNNIAVLGSSTAAGVGPSSSDSAWVTRYRNYLFEKNTTIKVINLAVGGYTTYDIMPTGYVPPESRPSPSISQNITKAVSYSPKAIIINLPSNDVSSGYSISEQLANYDTILSVANSNNIPVWITTTQPRNFSDIQQIRKQIEMRDSTYSRFGDKAIDFWTDIADSNGRINSIFDSGDGVHLNDTAHAVLFSRVVKAHVYDPLIVSVEEKSLAYLSEYKLMQNYPNPFNPSTKIEFSIFKAGEYSLKVFNILGEEIRNLFEKYFIPGNYIIDFNANELSSGIYIYILKNGNNILTKKMILIK